MLKIWTDGACLGNGTPQARGSWAFVTSQGYEESGLGEIGTSNNRMELTAVIRALQYCKANGKFWAHIYSDSMITINCAKGSWRKRSNNDLWLEYIKAAEGIRLSFGWVRGHSGDPGNERADELCTLALS